MMMALLVTCRVREVCKALILDYLADNNECRVCDLDEYLYAHGFTKSTMSRAKADLVRDGMILTWNEGFGPGKVWHTKLI